MFLKIKVFVLEKVVNILSEINHICFIVPNYPTEKDPMYTFVRELVVAISKKDIKCSVIAPQSITNFIYKRDRKRPFFWKDKAMENVEIDIFQPIHFPFFEFKLSSESLAGILTKRAIKRAFRKNNLQPDVLYAHFWHSGVIAGEISAEHNIPAFVASGESKIWVEKLYNKTTIQNAIKHIKGAIFVSKKNLLESKELELWNDSRSIVIPNSINRELFYKIDKNEAREKLGFSKEDFIVVFTGSFNHRKGTLRVSKALESFPNAKVIYIGSGEQRPYGDNILFSGRLPHKEIVNYLNAADVFLLPTLAEGSSNAIIEAMASGLPIISSDLPFNDEILDSSNSIKINPESIDEIEEALRILINDDQLRANMANNSLMKAKSLDVDTRAEKIIDFMIKHK